MTNKSVISYSGPNPKDINSNFPEHTYETIVCLLNGEPKRIIQDRYLCKMGYSKQTYLEKFPGAPLKSQAASDSYSNAALNDGGRRSKNLTKLNLTNKKFQINRKNGQDAFFQSEERSAEYRKNASENAKNQHKKGHAKYVQEYFATRYIGSEDQKARSKRMTGKNNIIYKPGVVEKGKNTYTKNHNSGYHNSKKKRYKNYDLYYQSSYELDFLNYCEEKNIIQHVSSAKTLKDSLYSRRYYLPDFVLYNNYIVEIKCKFIEQQQDKAHPGSLQEKINLVNRLGYKFLYVIDKDYTELDSLSDLVVLV